MNTAAAEKRDPDRRGVRNPNTLVIGLGNPILGDDGVGWKVAEVVAEELRYSDTVEVDYLSVGGLKLMERMLGYRRVVLVDAMQTGLHAEGAVSVLGLDDIREPVLGHTSSAHDTTLRTALQTAKSMGAPVPQEILIVAVEARNCYEFSEELHPKVADAVPAAAGQVLRLLKG